MPRMTFQSMKEPVFAFEEVRGLFETQIHTLEIEGADAWRRLGDEIDAPGLTLRLYEWSASRFETRFFTSVAPACGGVETLMGRPAANLLPPLCEFLRPRDTFEERYLNWIS
jgi:hypothetical protein